MGNSDGFGMLCSPKVETVDLPQHRWSSKGTKAPETSKPDYVSSLSSPLASQSHPLAESWSPASTARSSPPFDFDQVQSPAFSSASTLHKCIPVGSRIAAYDPTAEVDTQKQHNMGGGTPPNAQKTRAHSGIGDEREQLFRSFLRRLLGLDRNRNIAAFETGPTTRIADDPKLGVAFPGDGCDHEKLPRAAPSTDSDDRRHWFPSFVGDEDHRDVFPTLVLASKGDPPETDVESHTSIKLNPPPKKGEVAPCTAAGLKINVATLETLARAAREQGLVLPCAPSDEEKVMYYRSGRLTILTAGLLSTCTLFVGMCFFTSISAYFYWYGAPSLFVLVYISLYYFVVSAWGKDFDPELHADVVRKGHAVFAPTVDVFLPVCNEPLLLLANTWNHVLALDYPHVAVYVLDDGAKDEVQALAAEYGFQYIRRDNRPELKKAGNLRYAFARTSGEVFTILDADFCPRPDFLRETLPYLKDPSIGILQTPQFFRRREEQTWVEQGAGASQEVFYRLIQVNLDRFNAAVCVGSCGVYRRAAVEPFGGVAPIEHSEDMFTGYKMIELGFKIKYIPLCLAMGICPEEPRSFFMQQYRWCTGTCTLVTQRDFWRSNISKIHKLCFINGMLCYLSGSLFVFLGPAPILLLVWIKPDEVLWFYFGFAVPALIFDLLVIPSWSKQDSFFRSMPSQRVRVLQSYAYLFAIKDRLFGTVATWVPSGGGASKVSSRVYASSVRVLVTWNVASTVLIVGGSIWRATAYPWYDFIVPAGLALYSCGLSLSTLWH